jgi:hypothetical protein
MTHSSHIDDAELFQRKSTNIGMFSSWNTKVNDLVFRPSENIKNVKNLLGGSFEKQRYKWDRFVSHHLDRMD